MAEAGQGSLLFPGSGCVYQLRFCMLRAPGRQEAASGEWSVVEQ